MSGPVFIRGFHPDNRREVLLNVNHIWKIEVQYVTLAPDGTPYSRLHGLGKNDPDAIRVYDVFIGNEPIRYTHNADSKAFKIIEDLYKNAID